MATSKMAERVASRYLRAQGREGWKTPKDLLAAVEEVQGALHGVVQRHLVPDDATVEERRRLSAVTRAVKAMYDQAEEVRLDLDEWIIDYGEARKGG